MTTLAGPGSRLVVHDYGGYAFTVQLSRALASRGYQVLYLYCAGYAKRPMERRADDPSTFEVASVDIGEAFRKYSFARRLLQERRYGRLLAQRITAFRPGIVVSTNSPLDVQLAALRAARRRDARFVYWIQDIHSVAIKRLVGRRWGLAGRVLATRWARLEWRMLRSADAVIAITPDFAPVLNRWGIPPKRVSVVENWAPLDEDGPLPKANRWSIDQGLNDHPVLLYAGTLGLKHDPSALLALAIGLPEAKLVVISEGLGADWLLQRAASAPNLVLLPYQPAAVLSEVLASADVLITLLEAEAGVFSVPSKIYGYMAAGRPILAAIPRDNLAARTIIRAGAGRVVEPGDVGGLVTAGRQLLSDADQRAAAGSAARRYAESAFDIDRIADRVDEILRGQERSQAPVPATSHGLNVDQVPPATAVEPRQ